MAGEEGPAAEAVSLFLEHTDESTEGSATEPTSDPSNIVVVEIEPLEAYSTSTDSGSHGLGEEGCDI
jgi:hypothetical protein